VIALREEDYPILLREVTAERVKAFFGERVRGRVDRFELPNLGAVNLLLHEALAAAAPFRCAWMHRARHSARRCCAMEIEVD